MINIFHYVNTQYLLHFQIDSFLIYFDVIIFPLRKKKNQNKSTGTAECDDRFV